MASTATNRIAKTAADRLISGKTYRIGLLTANATSWKTAATAADLNVVNDIAADEASHASYARVTVTVTTEEDDTNNRAELHHSDATFPALEAAVGEVHGYFVMELVTNDTDNILVALIDLTVDIPTGADRTPDGNDFIVRDSADGFLWLATV
jgi:hypothetical protein